MDGTEIIYSTVRCKVASVGPDLEQIATWLLYSFVALIVYMGKRMMDRQDRLEREMANKPDRAEIRDDLDKKLELVRSDINQLQDLVVRTLTRLKD